MDDRIMPVKVVNLGFLALNAVKESEMKHHFHQVLGLPIAHDTGAGETYFACGNGHHALSLHRAQRPGFRHVGLQIAGDGPLADAAAALRAAGIEAQIKSDPVPGIKSCVEIADPDGSTVYLYREAAKSPAAAERRGIGPRKLGHLAMRTGNPQRCERFYIDQLGFKLSDWLGDFFVFLRCNVDHHTMNFITAKQRGMFHVAWELDDSAHLTRACDVLGLNRIKLAWGIGRHGPGHNLYAYHYDPDGNVIETFAELDRISNEERGYFDPRPYHRDNPQRPKVWTTLPADLWGPPRPASFEQ
jgi:YD repeat-containing protein